MGLGKIDRKTSSSCTVQTMFQNSSEVYNNFRGPPKSLMSFVKCIYGIYAVEPNNTVTAQYSIVFLKTEGWFITKIAQSVVILHILFYSMLPLFNKKECIWQHTYSVARLILLRLFRILYHYHFQAILWLDGPIKFHSARVFASHQSCATFLRVVCCSIYATKFAIFFFLGTLFTLIEVCV